jgi:glucose-1-phosphatase
VRLDADDVAVFDLGGVVARYHPERRLQRLTQLTQLTQLTEDEIVTRLFTSGLDHDAELGAFGAADIVAVVLAALDHRLSPTDLVDAWAMAFEPDSSVLDFIGAVPGRVCILTNNGPMLNHCLDGPLHRVRAAVSEVICSWELGVRKPDHEAFERAANRIGAEPSQLVLFDDDVRNVESARACGWRAVHVDRTPFEWRALAATLRLPKAR